jgi:hypothetical protein
MEDVNISKFRAQVVRAGSTPASPGFAVSEGQNPVDPSGSGQNHLPVTIGSPANGLAVTDAQILTIDKAQIFAGTSSQFVKGDGTLDSTAYGTGTVTSVALTMPTAFSVANSPVTTAGTLAVTATGTTSQYIRGDGSLETFPALTGFVPYTGATADVNLGTHDLAAERGTFANNGSSDTLTVNHTSGSGYGIIVTKGGNNEALYVSKTSGSGNAMTVVGGRTSLVDLALSSVTNTAGDFLTLSGGVVHKRTAAQTLTDIGGQAALTNPVTGTGTTNYLPKFTGASAIGNSQVFDDGTNVGIGTITPGSKFDVTNTLGTAYDASNTLVSGQTMRISNLSTSSSIASTLLFIATGGGGGNGLGSISGVNTATGSLALTFGTRDSGGSVTERARITSGGNLLVGTTTDGGARLQVVGSFAQQIRFGTNTSVYTNISMGTGFTTFDSIGGDSGAYSFRDDGATRMFIDGTGNVGIGTLSPTNKFVVSNGGALGYEIDPTPSTGTINRTLSYDRLILNYKPIEHWALSHTFHVSGGTLALTLASTGVATFSSTVETTGIKFPATQVASADANTLDDYEEGTWTASLTPITSGTISLSTSAGTFTKIGNQVTITAFLIVSSVSLPIGSIVYIGGLPFTIPNLDRLKGAPTVTYFDAPAYTGQIRPAYSNKNSTLLSVVIDASLVGNADEFYITFSYLI